MYKPKACVVCSKIFQPRSGNHLYCSKECRAPVIRAADNVRHRQPKAVERDRLFHKHLRETTDYQERTNAHLRNRYAEDPRYRGWKKTQRIRSPHAAMLIRKRSRARKYAVYHEPYTENEFLVQLSDQRYLDFYTDEPLFNGSIEPDITEEHVISLFHGGPDTLSNIIFIKASTNSRKNKRAVNVFLSELVREAIITQEAADRKINYLRAKLVGIMIQTWLVDWYAPNEFERLVEEQLGKS